ncbi:MAG TPA: Ig-like domain-containing protein, partial [Solirubrobacteraceae bacterium]|nr:Ig-like domain-containing protein [Solirubrobacteraceae bacterium]
MLLAALDGVAAALAPEVVIKEPVAGSSTNNQSPLFKGTTDDPADPIVLKIHEGGSAGPVIQTLNLPGPFVGTWETSLASPLAQGEYTAVAEQALLGETGSAEAAFTVDITAPKVTLNALAPLINTGTVTFGGKAGTEPGDLESVTLKIYAGETATGSPAQTIPVTPTSGTWTTEAGLANGTYTAVAEQSDKAGNTGVSGTSTFRVNTASPVVTLNQPASPSNDTKPSFSGEASETTTVTINVYAGSKPEGTAVSSASASGTGGGWSSREASPALSSGTYTAQATQPSSFGNPAGKSNPVTFVVNTASPVVSLNQPASPSNDTKPSFSGEASDTTAVTVKVYEGSKPEGTVVSSASASGTGGGWSSGEASPALSSGTYTAIATQPSSLGNPAGKSNSVTFVVNTASPVVTLNQPASPSNDTKPSFSGEASETTTVTISIYAGSKAEGTVMSSASASGTGGGWSSGEASPALSSGTYTAQATQPSSFGNPAGKSNPVTFVVNTASPSVTLNQPASPSNDTKPSFSGEASETTTVTVSIYAGSKAEGTVMSTATASGTGGGWSSGEASPA